MSPGAGKAQIDRFEGDWAVLQIAGKERRVHRGKLPANAKEGDIVDLARGTVDTEATRAATQRVEKLQTQLRKKRRPPGDFEL